MAKKSKKSGAAEYAGLAIGALIASKVSNMELPMIPAKIKPALPILLGIFLARKAGMTKAAGLGMIAVGATKLVGALAPSSGIGEPINDYAIEGASNYALSGHDSEGVNGTEAVSGNAGGSYALAGVDTYNSDLVG
jgi:hypothetical protein